MNTRTNRLAAGILLAALLYGLCQLVITTDPQSQNNIFGQTGTTTFTDTSADGPGPFFYRVGVQ